MSSTESEIREVVAAVTHTIPLDTPELPDEFFPAHLSVALIEAVFRSRTGHADDAGASAERYCRYFGISRTRSWKWKIPSLREQETLDDLIGHYDELGVERMKNEVFQAAQRLPGAETTRAEGVLLAARALRRMGVNVLQDVHVLPHEEIEDALHSAFEGGDRIARRLLMYTGDDDDVQGDMYVRRFVADALGLHTISATRARSLVQRSAYELILAPRYLYLEIRRYRLSRQGGGSAHRSGESFSAPDAPRNRRGGGDSGGFQVLRA